MREGKKSESLVKIRTPGLDCWYHFTISCFERVTQEKSLTISWRLK